MDVILRNRFGLHEISNYFNFSTGAGPAYSVYLSNFDKDKNTASLTKATFGNCILYNKNGGNALAFEKNDAAAFNYLFDTNIIRNIDTSKFNVTTAPNFLASITLDPMFVNTDYTANKLAVKKESPAKGKGKLTFAQQYPLDYNGQPRGTTPTIGALQ